MHMFSETSGDSLSPPQSPLQIHPDDALAKAPFDQKKLGNKQIKSIPAGARAEESHARQIGEAQLGLHSLKQRTKPQAKS